MTICEPEHYRFLNGIITLRDCGDYIEYTFRSQFTYVEGEFQIQPLPPHTQVSLILQEVKEKHLELLEEYIESSNPTIN